FVAKDAMTLAKVEAGVFALVSHATLFVGSISVAVAAVAAIHIFWGRDNVGRDAHPHEAPVTMLLPPLLLVALAVLFGLQPTLVDPLLGVAAQAMAPGFDPLQVDSSYDAWPVAEASLATFGFGLLIYLGWDRLRTLLDRARELDEIGPESWYWRKLKFVPKLAAWLTRRLQHGVLPGYLLTLAGAVTLALLAALLVGRPSLELPSAETLPLPVVGSALLIATGALATLLVRDHLVLLLVSGLVGYGSALLFLFTGAPDLAFTQFAVETVFVVVAATVLRRLRQLPPPLQVAVSEARWRPLALAVSIALGSVLSTLLLLAAAQPFDPQLSDFFSAQSVPAAHGRNVVNVIIVDFRALDTLGEIAVVALALVAALPLLKLSRRRSS
ncbi:MAG TPA: cation:proton antiporter, partial [Candidatus Accumulibacter sp.]|nr:cation:proton antiporter [Accumulibacter sp.]HCN66805.1 cation:proton antiporter [Accumulibacter sp.]